MCDVALRAAIALEQGLNCERNIGVGTLKRLATPMLDIRNDQGERCDQRTRCGSAENPKGKRGLTLQRDGARWH
jgi:hypothetical protein